MACTATATQRVKDSIIESLGLKSPVILESSFNSERIRCQAQQERPSLQSFPYTLEEHSWLHWCCHDRFCQAYI